jgi:hypothetical protein
MEVDLVARPSIGALEVDCELAAQLWPGVEGPLGEIHEPRPVHPSQGYRKVVGHDGLIISCRKDGGRVDLQEFDGLTVLSYFCDRWSQNLCGKTTICRCGTSATPPPPPETPGELGGVAHVRLDPNALVHVRRSLSWGCNPRYSDTSHGGARWRCGCPPRHDDSWFYPWGLLSCSSPLVRDAAPSGVHSAAPEVHAQRTVWC